MQNLLPRHLEIIYKINHFHMEFVSAKYNGDWEKMRVLSIVEEEGGKRINMAHLAIVGSHAVNGVAALVHFYFYLYFPIFLLTGFNFSFHIFFNILAMFYIQIFDNIVVFTPENFFLKKPFLYHIYLQTSFRIDQTDIVQELL